MHINKADVSFGENRVLAKWHGFINEDKSINYNFGQDFNNWFNDRFGLRKVLIPLYNTIQFSYKDENDKGIINKKTGFIYLKDDFLHIPIEKVDYNFKTLLKFNDWCNKNNIKLYVLLVPNKADIYPNKKPTYILEENYNEELIKYLEKEKKLKIVYPFEELKKASKNDYVFFKTEHHWSDYGAFIGYQSLMKEIKKDYKKVKVLNEKDFDFFFDKKVRGDFDRKFGYGTTAARLGITAVKKYHKVNYRYFKHKDFDNLKVEVIDEDFHKGKLYYYPKGANLRVIQLGTSQNENLDEFLPFTFKNIKRIRTNWVQGIPSDDWGNIMKYYEKEILDYKPDILIYCMTISDVDVLHKIFDKD